MFEGVKKLFEEYITKSNDLTVADDISISDSLPEGIAEASVKELNDFIDNVKKNSKDRKENLELYKEMSLDSLVGSALSIIADNAAQIDSMENRVIWATSDDAMVEATINAFLDEIHADEHFGLYAWRVLRDGGLFLRTFHDKFQNTEDKYLKSKRGRFFEIVGDYASVVELLQYGDCVGFYEEKEGKKILHSKNEFIHILSDRSANRENIKLSITRDLGKSEQVTIDEEFQARIGTSYLETAKEAYQMMSLIERLIMNARFAHSNYFKIVKIETGASSRVETNKILRETKRRFQTLESFNPAENSYSSNKKPVPHNGMLFVPTKGGKGDITIDEVGSNFDIKEVVDYDLYLRKLCSALKVPRAYLGEEDSGGMGNESLIRRDENFATSVKNLVHSVVEGFYRLVDYHLSVSGGFKKKMIGQYELHTTSLAMASDAERLEAIQQKVSLAESIKGLFGDLELDEKAQKKLYQIIITDVLKDPNLLSIIEDYGESGEEPEEDVEEPEEGEETEGEEESEDEGRVKEDSEGWPEV